MHMYMYMNMNNYMYMYNYIYIRLIYAFFQRLFTPDPQAALLRAISGGSWRSLKIYAPKIDRLSKKKC